MTLDLKTPASKASKVYAVSLAVLLALYGHAALTGSELNDDKRDTIPSEERASSGHARPGGFIYFPGYRGGK